MAHLNLKVLHIKSMKDYFIRAIKIYSNLLESVINLNVRQFVTGSVANLKIISTFYSHLFVKNNLI